MYNSTSCANVVLEVFSMTAALVIQLKILKLSNLKPNFSELARLYDVDRRTVKKYYDGYAGKPEHHDKPSKLDPYYDIIKQKLLIKGTTVMAVYQFIRSEVDSQIGSYSNFNKYVVSKTHLSSIKYYAIMIGKKIITHTYVISVIAPKRR